MGTITIESKETDILYIIDELAKRLGLKTKIESLETDTSIGREMDPNRIEDKKLFEITKSVRNNALADFLRNETEPIF